MCTIFTIVRVTSFNPTITSQVTTIQVRGIMRVSPMEIKATNKMPLLVFKVKRFQALITKDKKRNLTLKRIFLPLLNEAKRRNDLQDNKMSTMETNMTNMKVKLTNLETFNTNMVATIKRLATQVGQLTMAMMKQFTRTFPSVIEKDLPLVEKSENELEMEKKTRRK